MIDQNPQINTTEFEVPSNATDMQFIDAKDGGFWACPVCEDDGYLMDITEESQIPAAPSTPLVDKQPESKQPLYKVLNEQRTQGEWVKQGPKTQESSGQTYYTIHSKNSYGVTGFLYPYSDEKGNINHANIDYINLAVNNLAPMAEHLETISTECLKILEAASSEKKYIPSYILNMFGAISETAKQALNNIS